MRRKLGKIIFVRHGETEYTDAAFDLTSRGVRTIINSAQKISDILCNPGRDVMDIEIVSSPQTRATSSAILISRKLGYQKKIKEDKLLSAVTVKNARMGKAIFEGYTKTGGLRSLCLAYSTDPRFEDGIALEPRSAICQRFFEYLSKKVRQFLLLPSQISIVNICPCVINVSHYEVLYHFVESAFELNYAEDEPLGNGEIILISVYDIGIQDIVEFEIIFRDKKVVKNFDYKEKILI